MGAKHTLCTYPCTLVCCSMRRFRSAAVSLPSHTIVMSLPFHRTTMLWPGAGVPLPDVEGSPSIARSDHQSVVSSQCRIPVTWHEAAAQLHGREQAHS